MQEQFELVLVFFVCYLVRQKTLLCSTVFSGELLFCEPTLLVREMQATQCTNDTLMVKRIHTEVMSALRVTESSLTHLKKFVKTRNQR